eukprot:2602011-Pleurochrysis_carterae.AAC.1
MRPARAPAFARTTVAVVVTHHSHLNPPGDTRSLKVEPGIKSFLQHTPVPMACADQYEYFMW